MKHIRQFESFRVQKNRQEIISEAVLQVNDIYKVKTMIDIPQSLINSYVKKVKDTTGKNLRQFFGDVDIAEEIVKYITLNNTDVEKIPGNALMGGAQGQTQGQVQVQTEGEAQTQAQPQGQGQEQAQPQGQGQEQAQPQGQGQEQAQPQGQGQEQAQPQGEFEEPQTQPQIQGQEGQEEEEEGQEEEELPA
jgi:hypothetical protein